MSQVKSGDTVKIHFTAKLTDGTVVDSSVGGEPFEFEIGDSEILPELSHAVLDMAVGHTKILHLPPEKAFGVYDEALVVEMPRDSLPNEFDVEIGEFVVYENEEHEVKKVKVVNKDDSFLYFDFNHPLAGKAIDYEIKLIGIGK